MRQDWTNYTEPDCRSYRIEYHCRDARPEALLFVCTDQILDATLFAMIRNLPVVVLRTPGPIVPPYGVWHWDAESAIDEALIGLKVREIAICGHLPGEPLCSLLREENMTEWPKEDPYVCSVRVIRQIVEEKYGRLGEEEMRQAIVQENLLVQMANLRTYPAVITGLARGSLTLRRWIYDANRDELAVQGTSECNVLMRAGVPKQSAKCLLPFINLCDIYLT